MLSVPRSWSELTPAWATAALSPSFPGVVVRDVLVGEVAHGTNSRARVELGYDSEPGPGAVFVKREGRVFNRLALLALGAVDTEARLFASGLPLPIEHPAAYAVAIDRRRLATILVMEDVTLRGGHANSATVALSPDHVADGLRGLARLHAAHWDRPLPAAGSFLRPWRLGSVWAPVSFASLARALWVLGSRGQRDLVPSGVSPSLLERGFRRWARVAASGPWTVLHGDPHPGNTYTLPGGGLGFYDWQLVRTGTWSHDVGYFVVASLSVDDRRDHEQRLLHTYLDALRDAGAPAPTFDDAWPRYRETPAYGLATWLHTLSGGGFQPLEECLATIERFGAAYADHDVAARLGGAGR